jgi:hypothetical protein
MQEKQQSKGLTNQQGSKLRTPTKQNKLRQEAYDRETCKREDDNNNCHNS